MYNDKCLAQTENAISLFLIGFNKIFTGSVALSSVDPMAGTSQCPLRTVARTGRLVTGVASRPGDRWPSHTRLLLLNVSRYNNKFSIEPFFYKKIIITKINKATTAKQKN